MNDSISASFSLRVGQGIKGSNGYGIIEAETEFDDNSWDAGSNVIYKITTYNKTLKKSFMLHCDLGKSTSDPRNLLGIGSQIKKKVEGIGLKNMGTMNAACRYEPDMLHIYCKEAGGPIWTMTYALGAHKAEINRVLPTGETVDYRNVDKWLAENNIIDRCKMGPNYHIFDETVIKNIYDSIDDENAEMKATLKMITSGTQDQYTIIIGEYNSALREEITDGIYKTLIQSKMLYYKQLLSGKKIIYLNGENKKQYYITSKDAISPLGDVTQFARVLCKVRVYELQGDVCFIVALHIEDSNGISAESKQFCITDSQQLIKNMNFNVKLITSDVVIPSNAIYKGDITLRNSCLSLAAQDDIKNVLEDGGLGHRDDLRGIYYEYSSILDTREPNTPIVETRILGPPGWPKWKPTKKEEPVWGAVRNCGGLRAIVSCDKQWIAENIICILSEKHRTNLTNAHPVLKKLLDVVTKTIMKNYTSSDSGPFTNTGVKKWDLNKLYSQMTGIPLPKPATVTQPAASQPSRRRPKVADDSESISDASSVSSMQTASSSDDEIIAKSITFDLTIKELIIMNAGFEVARFNNYGYGSGLHGWLKNKYETEKDDKKFIEFIRDFASAAKK